MFCQHLTLYVILFSCFLKVFSWNNKCLPPHHYSGLPTSAEGRLLSSYSLNVSRRVENMSASCQASQLLKGFDGWQRLKYFKLAGYKRTVCTLCKVFLVYHNSTRCTQGLRGASRETKTSHSIEAATVNELHQVWFVVSLLYFPVNKCLRKLLN